MSLQETAVRCTVVLYFVMVSHEVEKMGLNLEFMSARLCLIPFLDGLKADKQEFLFRILSKFIIASYSRKTTVVDHRMKL